MVSAHASPLAAPGSGDHGGQNVHVRGLSIALAGRGHAVSVYTRRDTPELDRTVILADGVEVVHLDAGPAAPIAKDDLLPMMSELAVDLRRAWAHSRPDVAHAHSWTSAVATMSVARRSLVPTAITFHGLGQVKRGVQGSRDSSPRERIPIERHLARTVDRALATSRDEVVELRSIGAPGDRVELIPGGVDTETFSVEGPMEPRDPERPRVLVLGRLVERKGIGDVLEALAQLPGVEVVVAGGPPRERLDRDREAIRLEALARSLGVRDRVDLRGRVERQAIPGLLRSSDVVVCAPWFEPLGLAAVEAMSVGVPVVASAVGGLADAVVDGETGLLVPPRNPDAIASAVRALLGDRPLRMRMGGAGARRARTHYTWEGVARRIEAGYETLLAEGRGARAGGAVRLP
jgi:glycosyltransferase involved in cell wall biosynthesis